jgi:uncharacterized small protein (DUF1192 family)
MRVLFRLVFVLLGVLGVLAVTEADARLAALQTDMRRLKRS